MPAMLVAMVIAYLGLNLVQSRRLANEENRNINAGIKLYKSLMLLDRIRGMDKVIGNDADAGDQIILFSTRAALQQFMLDNLRALIAYEKNIPAPAQVKSLEAVVAKLKMIFANPVGRAADPSRDLEYEQILTAIQHVELQKNIGESVSKRIYETDYLLSTTAQSVTEVSQALERIAEIVAASVTDHERNQTDDDNLYKALGNLEAAHRRFQNQFAQLSQRITTPAATGQLVDKLSEKVSLLEGMAHLKAEAGHTDASDRFSEQTKSAIETAGQLYNGLIGQHIVINNGRLAQIDEKRSVLDLVGWGVILLILGLLVVYIRNNKRMTRKLHSLNRALAHSENNIRNIIELLPHVVVMQDAQGNVLMANKAFREFMRENFPQQDPEVPDFTQSDHGITRLLPAETGRLHAGESLSVRTETIVGSGGEKKVLHITSVLYPLSEKLNGVLSVLMDMTEIYRIKDLQKISGVGYWEWNLSKNVFNFSDKFCEIIGIPQGSVDDNFSNYASSIVDGDRQRVMYAFLRAQEAYTPIDIEHAVRRGGGNRTIVHVRGTVYQRSMDGSVHMAGTIQDVTVQKRTEEALIKSEMKYRKLLENLSDEYFFYSYDTRQEFTYISPSVASMLGYSNLELLESGMLGQIVDSGPLLDRDESHPAGFNEKLLRRNIELVSQNNEVRLIELSEMPVYSLDGEVVGFDGIAHDVTDNKLQEAHLKASQNRLRELAAHLQNVRENERASIARDIHDEIGGYLMALKMDISLLNKKLDKSDARIISRYQSMTQLLDMLIESTRRMITNLRPSVLDELGLLEVLDWQLRAFGKRCEIDVTFNHDDDIAKIEFDTPEYAVDIFRIFQEILNNVTKHAEASMVTTYTAIHDNSFVLAVSDDGKGAPQDATKKQGSYGILGMQERVYKMGGEMKFISEEGVGTTVILNIPLRRKPQGHAAMDATINNQLRKTV